MTDDALVWAGDEEAPPTARVEPTPLVEMVEPTPLVELVETSPAAHPRPQTPASLIVTYGVLAGLYLIYTAGWVINVARSTLIPVDVFTDLMFRIGQGLAIASPFVWFGAVFLLTRGRRPLVRLLWLLVGLAIVIPWPTLLGV